MSWEHDTANGDQDLLARMFIFLLKGHSLPPTYTGTGDGTITSPIGTATTVQETISVVFTSATDFSVTGSVSGVLGTGTVGTAFTCAVCAFTIVAGGTAWASGDAISWVMTPPYKAMRDVVGYSASSVYGDGNQAAHALDGFASSCWATANGTTTGWLEVDFGATHSIAQYAVQARNDISEPTSAPAAWTLEYWSGYAWVAADTQSGQTAWTQGQKRLFTLASPISASKWRINITANNGHANYTSLGALELRESVNGANIALKGCIWKAPGNANTDQIFFGVDPYCHVATDYYNWRLGAFAGYTEGALFTGQPGANVNKHLPLWNQAIPYWFIADGKHVCIIAHVSSVYEPAYLGFPDAYASPGQFPYPIMVGGSLSFESEPAAGSTSWRWSNTGNEHSAFWRSLNGASASLSLRRIDGTWATFDTGNVWGSTSYGSLWPYCSGSGDSSMTYLITNMDGVTYPTYPIIPHESQATYGELTGCRATTGYLQSAENLILEHRIPWLVIPNVYRSNRSDYAAFRLA